MSGKYFPTDQVSPKLLLLACAVREPEIRPFLHGRVDGIFLDYGLHRTRENMSQALQVEIDRAAERDYENILLGYGLCRNGILGLQPPKQPLIVPRVHDCISLFLGSSGAYQQQTAQQPGTYYLTSGWIEKGQTPLSKLEDYSRSYDPETAIWILKEEMRHYARIALIDTGLGDLRSYRSYAQQNAELLGIHYEELKGSLSYFQKLLWGPWDEDFLVSERGGRALALEMFL